MSIKQKLILAIGACMLALAGITAVLVGVASDRAIRYSAEEALEAASSGLGAMERADVERLDAALRALASHPGLVEAFRARDRERLLAVAAPILRGLEQTHGVTHLNVYLPDRSSFVRVHQPAVLGEPVALATLASAAETGAAAAGKELGATSFALRVVEPWLVGGRVVGYLELGEDLGRFLSRLRAQTGDDYALLVWKRDGAGQPLLQREAWGAMRARQHRPDDWGAFPDFVVADDTGAAPAALADLEPGATRSGGRLLPEVSRGARTGARGLIPVSDAGGRQVGAVVVLHDISALHDGMARARAGILLTLLAVAILMTLVLLALVHRLVFARLDRMTTSLEDLGARLAGGEYDVGALAPTGPRDELGRFEEFFGHFLVGLGALVKDLTARR